jgi:preprotein translocase subunit YajC
MNHAHRANGGKNMTAILASGTTSAASGIVGIILYIVVFGLAIYFLMVKPQKKEQQRQAALQNSVEPGDSILTTSGFYGNVIGVEDDTVIVEFGNNKNCRIPMKKAAIQEIEKAKQEV